MHLTVLSLAPSEPIGLAPSPSVSDVEHIIECRNAHQVPDITDLMAAPITILTTYRGWNLYCEGDVTVYRSNPLSQGANGYAGMPVAGTTEDVKIGTSAGWFNCSVRYDSQVGTCQA